jgi:hypothetical protein
MNEGEVIVAIAALFAGTVSISIIALAAARVFGARRRNELPGSAAAAIEQRLQRIEEAIDAMAVEVERVSEGQRYTTKLLADRTESRRSG